MSALSSISSMSAAEVGAKIDVAVARKALDTQKAMGDAAIDLLEGAKELAQQTGPDGRVSGIGLNLDVVA